MASLRDLVGALVPGLIRWLKEPLLHFVVIGAVLFAINRGNETAAYRVIVLTPSRLNSLADNFTRTWGKPPNEAEIRSLVDEYLREEIYNREAIRLGMDQDDAVIRRRLRQKMQAIADNVAINQPTPNELTDLYHQNKALFVTHTTYHFKQILLAPNQQSSSQKMIDRLRSLPKAQWGELLRQWHHSQLLAIDYHDVDEDLVRQQFGDAFAQQLRQSQTHVWLGPIASNYGQHLLYLEQRIPGEPLAQERVKPVLTERWFAEQRRQHEEAFYQRLRSQYTIDDRTVATTPRPVQRQ